MSPAIAYPQIDFSAQPSYLSNKTLSLTFDDGPDYTNTALVLDILKSNNIKATFFINTQNWSNVDTDVPMQALVRRIVQEGHELANHTVHHGHLPTMSADQIEAEIAGVEQTVKNLFGASAPRMTLFRAPYGEPYQGGDPNNPDALVAPIVAKHAVEIGWALDEFDYNCPVGDGGCVLANLTSALSGGAYGIVLMHSVHSQTVNALQNMIDYIRNNGYTLIQVEDVVRAKYGKSSAELVDGTGGGCTPNCSGKACGDDGCGGSCGTCPAGQACDGTNQCNSSCTPDCSGKTCGDDGCGGSCGTCPADCSNPSLSWNQASKTNFTSYPDPGSPECIQYNGCQYEGQFAACSGTLPVEWVQAHNIVAVHEKDFGNLKLHDLCLRSGSSTIVVTVYDECADSDCSGCCTQNAAPSGNLVDVESFTDARWGVADGQIEWADLGPTSGSGCN